MSFRERIQRLFGIKPDVSVESFIETQAKVLVKELQKSIAEIMKRGQYVEHIEGKLVEGEGIIESENGIVTYSNPPAKLVDLLMETPNLDITFVEKAGKYSLRALFF